MKQFSKQKRITFLIIVLFSLWGFKITEEKSLNVYPKKKDVLRNVQIGTITYSFRSMPEQSLGAILDYAEKAGVSSVELMGPTVEQYAGIPETSDKQKIRDWRLTVSKKHFRRIKKMFDKKKINIHILKIGKLTWSDEEIDYAFEVCKALGAKGISMEISEEAAKRMAPFAEKHKRFVIFHNHFQPADSDFSFDKMLGYGSNLMLNLDVGHYFGATGLNPCRIIERLHDRIVSIHLKDKTGPAAPEPNSNLQFGKGETPVAEILKLIQKNNWSINCDIELEYQIPEGSNAVLEVQKCVNYCKEVLE